MIHLKSHYSDEMRSFIFCGFVYVSVLYELGSFFVWCFCGGR